MQDAAYTKNPFATPLRVFVHGRAASGGRAQRLATRCTFANGNQVAVSRQSTQGQGIAHAAVGVFSVDQP